MTQRTAVTITATLIITWGIAIICASWGRAAEFQPVQCTVTKVTDGDTFRCEFSPPLWGPYRETAVRIDGIDTPESHKPPARCIKEQRLGVIAAAEMRRRVPVGSTVTVIWTGHPEKYGRVLARVTLPDGKDWADEMARLGFARAYHGGKKGDWCK